MSVHVGRHDIDTWARLWRLHDLLHLADHRQAGDPEEIRLHMPALYGAGLRYL